MKKRLIIILYLFWICIGLFSLTNDEFNIMSSMARVSFDKEINDKRIPGYVYFEGFNFEGYEAESDGTLQSKKS